jgi:ABC-type uncharacterized transport system auxiliary subunit
MTIQRLKHAALLPLLASTFVLAGCDNTDNRRPASAAPIPETPAAPTKIPTTPEEKIQAIQNSSLPQKQKDAEIARVRAGQL